MLAHGLGFKLDQLLDGHYLSLCSLFVPAFLVDRANYLVSGTDFAWPGSAFSLVGRTQKQGHCFWMPFLSILVSHVLLQSLQLPWGTGNRRSSQGFSPLDCPSMTGQHLCFATSWVQEPPMALRNSVSDGDKPKLPPARSQVIVGLERKLALKNPYLTYL